MRATGIFTGTTSSPCQSARQSHFRYAIRAGRNLPDKKFRSRLLRFAALSQQLFAIRLKQRRGVDISATLCMSPCSSDYIFSNKLFVGIWHIVSEDSSRDLPPLVFPADYLHPTHCHEKLPSRSVGYSDLPAYSQILLRLANR